MSASDASPKLLDSEEPLIFAEEQPDFAIIVTVDPGSASHLGLTWQHGCVAR
jgi:hypothetical protein